MLIAIQLRGQKTMQLSDRDIFYSMMNGEITIDDFDLNRLQSASYDVLLGNSFLTFEKHAISIIDPKSDIGPKMTKVHKDEQDSFILHPGQFALGVTRDRIGVDASHSCQIDGKSSMARFGIIVHTTAGYIDPGNTLNITLELFNANAVPIILYPGMKIAQVRFYRLTSECLRPYGTKGLNSKYFQSKDVEASRMHKNWKNLDSK
ncbi:MAG: dCTP deaminase [Patescibacteria group bacterium]